MGRTGIASSSSPVWQRSATEKHRELRRGEPNTASVIDVARAIGSADAKFREHVRRTGRRPSPRLMVPAVGFEPDDRVPQARELLTGELSRVPEERFERSLASSEPALTAWLLRIGWTRGNRTQHARIHGPSPHLSAMVHTSVVGWIHAELVLQLRTRRCRPPEQSRGDRRGFDQPKGPHRRER